jgi:hypothetical protein
VVTGGGCRFVLLAMAALDGQILFRLFRWKIWNMRPARRAMPTRASIAAPAIYALDLAGAGGILEAGVGTVVVLGESVLLK